MNCFSYTVTMITARMKKRPLSVFLPGPMSGFLLLFISFCARAQMPKADFSASAVTGCAPLSVSFKDLSTGSPKFWSWDFGNGQLSNLQNPGVAFTSPGKYTVTLVVRNANGTNGITKTDYIVVKPSPAVDFSANNTTGCVPVTDQFTGTANAAGETITSWKWDFGDGTSSAQQNPQKVYSIPGFYTVSLIATSSSGCTGSVGKGRYIRIVPGVKADFSNTPPATCRPPFSVNFSTLTSGPGKLNYKWTFGDGNSSTQSDPVNVYGASGTYNVKLMAMSEFGCGDSIQKTISVNGTNTAIKSPDTVCFNTPVTFENISSPAATSSQWIFGNGASSDKTKDTTTYTSPGTYAVKLISSYNNCTDSALKNIVVQGRPTVDFTADNTTSCKTGFTVNFRDISPGSMQSQWDFGDSTPLASGQAVSHTYSREGKYSITLTMKTKYGCENTVTKKDFIVVAAPQVSINSGPGACSGEPFSATANVSAVDGVSSYNWDFGDGTTASGGTVTHVYAAGQYTMRLTVVTKGGCTLTATQQVKSGTHVTPSFTAPASPVCPFTPISFSGNATPAPAGLEWQWDFGDSSALASGPNVTHSFTNNKTFDVTLSVINFGCASTVTHPVAVKPPIPAFVYAIKDCSDPKTLEFASLSKVGSAPVYSWNFGDGTPATFGGPNPPSVTFPSFGIHRVKLTITDDGCPATFPKDIKLVSDSADFTVSSSVMCKNTPFKLAAIHSQKADIVRYDWIFKTATDSTVVTTTDSVLTTSLPNSGTYNVILRITDINSCRHITSAPVTIQVTGPKANFSLTNSKGCFGSNVVFTDLSTNNGPLRWKWDFGDGGSAPAQNPTHSYADSGKYTVKLTVTDNNGCQDTLKLKDTVWLSKVKAAFSSNYTTICPGVDIKFKDSSAGYRLHYLWSFGDGGTSVVKNPLHRYAGADSSYTVKLVVQDSAGCRDSISNPAYRVRKPKPSFTLKNAHSICPLLETKFTLTSRDYESVYWDFGDGFVSTLESPSHFYNVTGNYEVTLHTIGYGGCEDSAKDSVHVYDPYSTTHIKYGPKLSACNELMVDFAISPTPHTFYTFAFGDGALNTRGDTVFQHLYTSYGNFVPAVLLKDSIDCQTAVGNGPGTIRIIGADAFFSPDKKAFCDTGTVYFTYYHIGNDPIASNTWNLGDGTTSTTPDEQNIVHQYTKPGTYQVIRTVTTQAGCTKSEYDTVRIYRTPDPSIVSDSVLCVNSPALIKGVLSVADTAIQWNWKLGNGSTSTLQNPSVIYGKVGPYTLNLEAANKLNCRASTSKNIRVAPLPIINMGANPVIPVGTGINLPVSYLPEIANYTWTPAKNLSCTDCAVPFANPRFTTTYHVSITDNYGCKNGKDVTVTVVCNEKNYFVPNTFSPNHDGVNDVFYPRGSSIARVSGMRIYNRWGDLVFERRNFNVNDPSAGWDGTFKGKPANSDTYVYVIEFICENAGIVPYRGNITLIR